MTNSALAGTVAVDYGFSVTEYGVGIATFDVGSRGAAFGVADDTEMTVLDMLLATDLMAVSGQLYGTAVLLRNLANEAYSAVNEQGDI